MNHREEDGAAVVYLAQNGELDLDGESPPELIAPFIRFILGFSFGLALGLAKALLIMLWQIGCILCIAARRGKP
ncbi:MAG: hypothetical protein VR67_17430 [Peptococcaceae bacterium BRH_c8a]|nr:MAG: hypothetical protein VR67_17430 [Peptococcaceae bacterium BRH_c8a]